MDSGGITQIIVFAVLLMFSAYFSATETAFSAANRIRIKNLAADGNKKAMLVQKMSENFDKILSTILIGNNIVNILATVIATSFWLEMLSDPTVSSAVSTAVTTVLVLIFGEITPKSIAKDSPERFAMFSAPFLRFLMIILTPLNIVFSGWKKLVSLVFKPKNDVSDTEAELLTIVEEAETEGDMEAGEVELIRNAIEFNDIEVGDILQPRVDVVAIDSEDTWDEVDKTFRETGYSRLPVYRDTIDNIIGVVNQKDFYMAREQNLRAITKPIDYVVPTMKISELMVKLQKSKAHMAAVADEYGGTAGIITLEDVIEELVGEIWDEHDEIVEEFRQINKDEHRILCSANLDDMFEYLDIEADVDIPTVSGWVVEELKHMPVPGDTFEYENLSVKVTKCDPRHVLEIVVKVNEKTEDEEE
ncbi:MAG: HlyC/CorC family transporter [Ruminococcaceae bacterium]|nr:HlyC/CorC family transporter [Oscillospiraceae bacterium]